jgi:hypothetical protein
VYITMTKWVWDTAVLAVISEAISSSLHSIKSILKNGGLIHRDKREGIYG